MGDSKWELDLLTDKLDKEGRIAFIAILKAYLKALGKYEELRE